MATGGYDEGYRVCPCFWGEKPAELVLAAIEMFGTGQGRRAIDLGCGEGKNAAAMSRAGFQVVAIDKSDLAIANARSSFADADVNWLACDITQISGPPSAYDLVIATGSLHCLKSEAAIVEAISLMQKLTRKSGFNVLSSFNDGLQDMNGHDVDFEPTLLSHQKYAELYSGWEIIRSSNVLQKDAHPHNGVEHSHSITRILAKRPE